MLAWGVILGRYFCKNTEVCRIIFLPSRLFSRVYTYMFINFQRLFPPTCLFGLHVNSVVRSKPNLKLIISNKMQPPIECILMLKSASEKACSLLHFRIDVLFYHEFGMWCSHKIFFLSFVNTIFRLKAHETLNKEVTGWFLQLRFSSLFKPTFFSHMNFSQMFL